MTVRFVLYQNNHGQHLANSPSCGVGGGHHYPKPSQFTKKEIQDLEKTQFAHPHYFTGLWKGQYYHKGSPWTGPSNNIGFRG